MQNEVSEKTVSILIIDDDIRLQEAVSDFLTTYHYTVTSLGNGNDIEAKLPEIAPDLVLLDVMLPGDDGFTLLRRMRTVSQVPVIMLTAKGDDMDRVIGLELGADDYMAKPFNPRELLARIKAVLRRFSADPKDTDTAKNPEGIVQTGSVILDTTHQVLRRGTAEKILSTTEFRIIKTFMDRAGEVLSREQILTLSFGEEHYVSDRNIDVYINRIRNMLRDLGDSPNRIRTVWGAGYSWIAED